MISFTTLAITVLATLAAARNCTPGLRYCGSTLREIATGDNYDIQIREAFVAFTGNRFASQEDENKALFLCLPGPDGDVRVHEVCDISCRDNGNDNSDSCNLV
ncbi:hypothetical protein QBC37DRAFT_456586 [Rhypophila decipiens]|uniref:Uncharacterized protein n=1 Tax=Rhypophila decipiens TaxID=261697 RepID=A0AAN7B244_9PEZI|nr:hypothetical protein QBC37DRAFT_456586 [Rhypophila decipiens]